MTWLRDPKKDKISMTPQNTRNPPRDTVIECNVKRLYAISERLRHQSAVLGRSWRQIATLPEYSGISHGTLDGIAGGRYPKKQSIQVALGLNETVMIEAPAGVAVEVGAIVQNSTLRCDCGCAAPFVPAAWNQKRIRGHRRPRGKKEL